MRLIILLLLVVVSCARSPSEVGVILTTYEWKCVSSKLAPGMSTNGDFTLSSVCAVSKCFKVTKKNGANLFSTELISRELVDDRQCIN